MLNIVMQQCDHAEIYKEISDENLELMRERLMETIVWPTDEKTTEQMLACTRTLYKLYNVSLIVNFQLWATNNFL